MTGRRRRSIDYGGGEEDEDNGDDNKDGKKLQQGCGAALLALGPEGKGRASNPLSTSCVVNVVVEGRRGVEGSTSHPLRTHLQLQQLQNTTTKPMTKTKMAARTSSIVLSWGHAHGKPWMHDEDNAKQRLPLWLGGNQPMANDSEGVRQRQDQQRREEQVGEPQEVEGEEGHGDDGSGWGVGVGGARS